MHLPYFRSTKHWLLFQLMLIKRSYHSSIKLLSSIHNLSIQSCRIHSIRQEYSKQLSSRISTQLSSRIPSQRYFFPPIFFLLPQMHKCFCTHGPTR